MEKMIGMERELRRRFESGAMCPWEEKYEKRSYRLGSREGQFKSKRLVTDCFLVVQRG